MTPFRALLAWIALLAVAFPNGAPRHFPYPSTLGDFAARQVAASIGAVAFGFLIWFILRPRPIARAWQAWATGAFWKGSLRPLLVLWGPLATAAILPATLPGRGRPGVGLGGRELDRLRSRLRRGPFPPRRRHRRGEPPRSTRSSSRRSWSGATRCSGARRALGCRSHSSWHRARSPVRCSCVTRPGADPSLGPDGAEQVELACPLEVQERIGRDTASLQEVDSGRDAKAIEAVCFARIVIGGTRTSSILDRIHGMKILLLGATGMVGQRRLRPHTRPGLP